VEAVGILPERGVGVPPDEPLQLGSELERLLGDRSREEHVVLDLELAEPRFEPLDVRLDSYARPLRHDGLLRIIAARTAGPRLHRPAEKI